MDKYEEYEEYSPFLPVLLELATGCATLDGTRNKKQNVTRIKVAKCVLSMLSRSGKLRALADATRAERRFQSLHALWRPAARVCMGERPFGCVSRRIQDWISHFDARLEAMVYRLKLRLSTATAVGTLVET